MSNSAAPLLIVGGAALLLMSGKKKNKNGNGKPKCPPIAHIDSDMILRETIEVEFGDGERVEMSLPKIAYYEAVGGNRDIMKIAAKVLAPFLPESCISSESIKVDLMHDAKSTTYTAVDFTFHVASDTVMDLYQAGLFSEEELQVAKNDILKWWVEHMGDAPLPKD
jgi:hypothetical protein